MVTQTKLIILDRDGVINLDSDDYIKSPDEWIPISGSLQAIARLNKAGYKVAIATNQSGIARGYYSLETLSQMHQKMDNLLAEVGGRIDTIAFCPHGPDDGCSCRKPKPGMLLEIAKHYSIQPELVTFVGDTATDNKAAEVANMQFVLVKTGKGKATLASKNYNSGCCVHDSLEVFIDRLLST